MDREDVLKRVLDFKLVYDCLAEPKSGLVCLDVLLSSWPSLNTLPRDLEKFWRQSANSEGYLDWEGFSGGLKKALVAADEQFRKGRVTSSTYKQSTACKPTTRKPLPQVTSGELERFLSSCHNDSLVKALAKAGKDVHRWQVSIHKQNSIPAGKKDVVEESRHEKGKVKHRSSLSAGREREELMRGREVLEKTRQWFESRLAVLSLEEQQQTHTSKKQLHAEDLLAELEGGGKDGMSLHHIQEINSHLSSLALTAKPDPVPAKHPMNSSEPTVVVENPSLRGGRQRRLPLTPSRAVRRQETSEQRLLHSVSLPAASSTLLTNHNRHPFTPRRLPHRSSSFNDRSKEGYRSQPVRAASSMTTLTQPVTDYPGHHPSPHLQRPIHHSSSVHSLPGRHPPPPSHTPLFSRPPSRTRSAQSLTSSSQIVSEVL